MRTYLLLIALSVYLPAGALAQEIEGLVPLTEEGEAKELQELAHARARKTFAEIDLAFHEQSKRLVSEFQLILEQRLDDLAINAPPAEVRDLRATASKWFSDEGELALPAEVPPTLAGVVKTYQDSLASYAEIHGKKRRKEYHNLIRRLDGAALALEKKEDMAGALAMRKYAKSLMPLQTNSRKFGDLEIEVFEWSFGHPPFVRVRTHENELLALGRLQGKFGGAGDSQMIGYWDLGAARGLIGYSQQRDVTSACLALRDPRLKLADSTVRYAEVNPNHRRERLIHSSRGFCHLVGVGGVVGDLTRYDININPEDGFYYFTARVEAGDAIARAAIVEYPEGKTPDFEVSFVTWKQGDSIDESIDAKDGICLMTGVRGGFAGTGEAVHVQVDSAGKWQVGGRSNVINTSVTALVLKFKE